MIAVGLPLSSGTINTILTYIIILEVAFYRKVSDFEPLIPNAEDKRLSELSVEIFQKSGQLNNDSLGKETLEEVRTIVRLMNSYYSNLIEGHHTNPRELKRALDRGQEKEDTKRKHRLSRAHMEVEQSIEDRLLGEPQTEVYSKNFLSGLHYDFYSPLPEEDRIGKYKSGKSFVVVPGEIRDFEVDVGKHQPPHSQDLARFLERFNSFYTSPNIRENRSLIAAAAAHHRFLWIHPFADGNGRVARLMTHAAFVKHRIGGCGLWTLSRGLARKRTEYFDLLANADRPREGDLDGRGNLSDRQLAAFCVFLLEVTLDQITFMTDCLGLHRLRDRIRNYVEVNNVFGTREKNQKGIFMLHEILVEGRMPRGDAIARTGYKDTKGRELLNKAIESKLIKSEGPKSAVQIAFPEHVLDYYFPNLFAPENPVEVPK